MAADSTILLPTPWWRRWRWLGTAATLALAAVVLIIISVSDDAAEGGGRYQGAGVTVGAEVLDYHPPLDSKDPTGVVSVAYQVGSSEMRTDIDTRHTDFGPTVDIVYDPDDPSHARIADEG